MLDRFKAWAAQPFRSDMSALEWFLFFGLLVIISGVWAMILRHIRGL